MKHKSEINKVIEKFDLIITGLKSLDEDVYDPGNIDENGKYYFHPGFMRDLLEEIRSVSMNIEDVETSLNEIIDDIDEVVRYSPESGY